VSMTAAIQAIPPRTPEQAEQTARRHNRNVAKRYPLLASAGQLPAEWLWTADHVMEDEHRWRAFFLRLDEETAKEAGQLRGDVAQLVTADQLLGLDERQARLPASPEYAADFWRQQLRELGVADWWERYNPLEAIA
jgi:hypothetical protein